MTTASQPAGVEALASAMDRVAAGFAGLAGWKRLATAFASGVLGAFAFAPYDLWPLLFLSFGSLVWLLDGAVASHDLMRPRLRTAGWIGFAFGFGFFLAGYYWIAEAFLVEPERHGWLIPFVLLLFPAWMALYFAGATVMAAWAWSPGAARVFALAAAFGLAEFIRGHLFTGQPWNLIGYSLTSELPSMQLVSLVGVYGLTILAVLLFASPFAIFGSSGPGFAGRRGAGILALLMTVLLAIGSIWGASRLAENETRSTDVGIRIVQTSVDQKDKWKPENAREIFNDYLAMSETRKGGRGLADAALVVWPETAIPVVLEEEPEALVAIADMLPQGTTLLVGSLRVDRGEGGFVAEGIYNGLLAIGTEGQIVDAYDKMHLVPFGEYLPFQDLMESIGIMQLTGVRGGFSTGEGPRRLQVPGVPPMMPLICYEILFPDEVNSGEARVGWMLNVTNDAWFGRSIGPYQHFHQARVRAVEQGLPLVRAANTGISAIIDPYGRIVTSIGLQERGVADALLPASLGDTSFVRHGRMIEVFLWLLVLGACLTCKMQPAAD